MKGVIFDLVEEFIIEISDEETFEEIFSDCNFITEEPFVGPGTYPDEDLMELLNKAITKLDIPLPDALRSFGKGSFPNLVKKIPPSFVDFEHPKTFLMTVENIVHVEVRKLYIDANPPRFDFEDNHPDHLVINYESSRRLYDLMDGLIEGVGEYFNSPIKYSREIAERYGGEICKYHLTFATGA
jgi:hypothetical protein